MLPLQRVRQQRNRNNAPQPILKVTPLLVIGSFSIIVLPYCCIRNSPEQWPQTFVSASDWAISVSLCSLPGFGATRPPIFHLLNKTERPSYLWRATSRATSRSPNFSLHLFCVAMFVSCHRHVTPSITSRSSKIC